MADDSEKCVGLTNVTMECNTGLCPSKDFVRLKKQDLNLFMCDMSPTNDVVLISSESNPAITHLKPFQWTGISI